MSHKDGHNVNDTRRRLLKTAGATVGTTAGLGLISSTAAARETGLPIEDEDKYEDWAVWQYRETIEISDWEKTSPINIVIDGADLSTVEQVLQDAGWEELEIIGGQEYTRYAWNTSEQDFELPDLSYGTSDYRLDGGFHVRCWEHTDNKISIQAHEDDSTTNDDAGHQIVSYKSAEEKVVGILEEHSNIVQFGSFDMQNAKDDHDGTAAAMLPWD
ncbi:MAG: hypothetical protein SXQ77_03375 [Halobacteria archaeon]|nr:hypothetical protein [Halobacteria archaeon]